MKPDRARAALDRRLDAFRPVERFAVPPKGWVRAIRDALGMSGAQLGDRLGVTPQSVLDLEKSEAAGTARLETLQRAAAAMDCALVYALVPRRTLAETVRDRARMIARRELGGVSHSMAMEDQATGEDDLDERIDRFVEEVLRERDLWRDR